MIGPSERLEHIVGRLRANGYRLTPQRGAILQVLLSSHPHPTAREIHRQVSTDFPMMSLATVYKTLNVLKDLGEVRELKVEGCSHYDTNTLPHAHLICERCHRITDLPLETLAGVRKEALAETGLRDLRCAVQIHGLCTHCQKQAEE
jgi:Fur family peroxide stress response transcriptional regulator